MPAHGHSSESSAPSAASRQPGAADKQPSAASGQQSATARQQFVDAVNSRCRAFLLQRREQVTAISHDAAPLVDALLSLTAGGKKLRPVLAWIGWRTAAGDDLGPGAPYPALVNLGAALELFQAAALVHDDVIDRSSTRRGQPSAHQRFEQIHRESGYAGEAAHFGTTGAILSGDLALAWASELFDEACRSAGGETARAQQLFRQMHTEVITGQYLDVLAEVAQPAESEVAAVRRARNVLTYKAAKYSTEYPAVLGCALSGGSQMLQQALAEAALPLGIAFQLRDDLLGVFGEPETTGKPVGDDLREGKRTELIAYGLHRSEAAAAAELEAALGNPQLSAEEVCRAREILEASGARTAVEAEIARLTVEAEQDRARLPALGVSATVLQDFDAVADRLVSRRS